LKDKLAGAVVDEMRGAGSETSCPGAPVAGKDPIVEADEELTIPLEGCVIGAAQDEAHRVAVATNERDVLFSRLSRAVAGKDVVNLLDGDGDTFTRCSSRDRLGLEVAAEPTRPRPGNRAPLVQLGFPAVQFPSEADHGGGGVRK
jgi:hypothetical protein